MDIEEAVKIADELVYQQTGDRLNGLQVALLRGALADCTYEEIKATEIEARNYQTSYLARDVAPKLWGMLGEVLQNAGIIEPGEKVGKKNIWQQLGRSQTRASLTQPNPTPSLCESQRKTFPSANFHTTADPYINSLPIPGKSETRDKFSEVPPLNSRQDWESAPDISRFHDRQEPLTHLQHWIVVEKCRLVAILGLGGIGKTALSVRLAQQMQTQFDFLVWRSLRYAPSLADLLADLQCFFYPQQHRENAAAVTHSITQLMEVLRQRRCLLIFDSLEAILQSNTLAGSYRPGYENYGELMRRVGEEPHQSCLLITSCEKPSEIGLMEGKTQPVRSFLLKDLETPAARSLLQEQGLFPAAKLDKLIQLYRGNPLALKIVSGTILQLFAGNVTEFLKQNTVFVGKLQKVLDAQFERLTPLEIEIMVQLAIATTALSLPDLKTAFADAVRTSSLMEALESLAGRSLVENHRENAQPRFSLQPVIRKYVLNRFSPQ